MLCMASSRRSKSDFAAIERFTLSHSKEITSTSQKPAHNNGPEHSGDTGGGRSACRLHAPTDRHPDRARSVAAAADVGVGSCLSPVIEVTLRPQFVLPASGHGDPRRTPR